MRRSRTSAPRAYPPLAVRTYLEELGRPAHDVHLDLARLGRLAIEAIAAMPDDELAAAAGADESLARALRGARTLVEAREIAADDLRRPRRSRCRPRRSRPWSASSSFGRAAGALDEAGARAIVRELKAVGGDLRVLRLALTGAERGPELWTVVAALPEDEAIARARRGRAASG